MEFPIFVGLSVVLVLFVWTWIGLAIVSRMQLERKIEKLENIENRLPEEERSLNHLKELRAIEQNKVGGAKLILGLFGLLVAAALGAAVFYQPMYELFGSPNLTVFVSMALAVLAFIVIPTYVGLTLAGSSHKQAVEKRVKAAPKKEEAPKEAAA